MSAGGFLLFVVQSGFVPATVGGEITGRHGRPGQFGDADETTMSCCARSSSDWISASFCAWLIPERSDSLLTRTLNRAGCYSVMTQFDQIIPITAKSDPSLLSG